ncbi:GNAT family N-acetyltransferase [Variovorax boronicumulans]|uniref:GNAT family N-acetyltransferase n=1 Tax=Variovorax boronicumulans TaxID=436515 RepID=UPI00339A7A2F
MSASENTVFQHGKLVRRLTAADAAAYRALMLNAYATHPSAFTTTVAEREDLPLSWWAQRLGAESDAPSVVYGAFDDSGALVGAAGLSFGGRERERHKATLFGMSVIASARRAGFGRRLVLALLDHARAHGGLRLVQLTVTEGNSAAQTLYERCGFRVFGVEPQAVALDDVFFAKVHMWCDLQATNADAPSAAQARPA